MATDPRLTGPALDRALELEEARLSERVRMRMDSHQDEDTGVIEIRAAENVKAASAASTPPHAKSLIAVLNTLPGWGRVVVLLALIAALATGGTKLSGLW